MFPTFYQTLSSRPPLQGYINNNNNGSGFWGGVKDIAKHLGRGFIRGVEAIASNAAYAEPYHSPNLTSTPSPDFNQMMPTQPDWNTGLNTHSKGQNLSISFSTLPPVQGQPRQRIVQQMNQQTIRQNRLDNLNRVVDKAQGSHNEGIGGRLVQQQSHNPFPLQGRVNTSRFVNDVIENTGQPLGGYMPFAPNAFSPSPRHNMYARSRQQLDHFRQNQQRKKEATIQREHELALYREHLKQINQQHPPKDIFGQPFHGNGARINIPLIPPEGLYSSNAKGQYPSIPIGEQSVGRNTNNKPLLIAFNSDKSLANQLWDNFYRGEGQPLQVNMNDLDLDDNLNIKQHFETRGALGLLRQNTIDADALSEALGKKIEAYGNNKVTHIFLKDDITDMQLHFEKFSPEWAAFGQLAVNMSDVHIMVHHDRGNTIEVHANLKPNDPRSNELDIFDFNPDANRPWYAEAVTQTVHYIVPGTSFKIYGKGKGEFYDSF